MSDLRAHFPEREAYLDRLAQHYADGVLDDAGFEARRDLLLQATTHGEMLRAFDGLPRPRYLQDGPRVRRSGLGRRGLLLGGIAGIAAVGVGGFAISAQQGTYYAEDTVYATSPADVEDVNTHQQPDVELLHDVYAHLQDRGLGLIAEFALDVDGVTGAVMSPRHPGEVRTISKQPDRPVIVSEAVISEVLPSVELEPFYETAMMAFDDAVWALGGEGFTSHLGLSFTERGTPTVVVDVMGYDDVLLGSAQYDMEFNLIALEEYQ